MLFDGMHTDKQCPAAEWQTIDTYLTLSNNILLVSYQEGYMTISPDWLSLTGQAALRQLYVMNVPPANTAIGFDPEIATATTQQAAISDALTSTGALWLEAMSNTSSSHGSILNILDAIHSIRDGYYQPYTAASCAHDVINGISDERVLVFPTPPGSIASIMLDKTRFNNSTIYYHPSRPSVKAIGFEYKGITRSEIWKTSGPIWESRLKWIELPQDPFNGTAIGAVILLPRNQTDLIQQLLVCNLGAGWGSSLLNTSTSQGGSSVTKSSVGKFNPRTEIQDGSAYRTEDPNTNYIGETILDFILPHFPERPITVTEDWAKYLNPSISVTNTTVFNSLMNEQLTVVGPGPSARIILATLLANGLARIESASQLQGTVRTVMRSDGSRALDGDYWFSGKGNAFNLDSTQQKNDWVKFSVSTTIEGYAYNTHSGIIKVAIAFLFLYCFIAIAHALYAGITGTISTRSYLILQDIT